LVGSGHVCGFWSLAFIVLIMIDKRPIGLFDSGVGGLSVLLAIKKKLPKESFVFFADQGHNPYGEKSPKQLKDLSEKITKFLVKKHDIKLLVIACNTATCYALDYLRSAFKIPIVGVVPAIKPAVSLSKKKNIVIMSTPATARSLYLKNLVANFARHSQTLRLGCEGLEESIEYLKMNKISKLLDIYASKVEKAGADVIVLGCTHFPFFKKEIKERVGSKVKVIDSGGAIAKRVAFILKKEQIAAVKKFPDVYYTTGNPEKFSKVASILLKYKVVGQKARLPSGKTQI